MSKISKNALCPCGSDKKLENCCATKGASNMQNVPAGIGMKGGVIFDEDLKAYIPIVHRWNNVNCLGKPKDWRSEEIFSNTRLRRTSALASSRSHPEMKEEHSILILSSGIVLPGVVVQFALTDLPAHNGNRAETMAETEN